MGSRLTDKMATNKRVVPWFGTGEWCSVYQELFSDNVKMQQHAVDRIAVWKCRQGNKLSFGIECSWQLIIAQLQDKRAEQTGNTLLMDQQLRLTYSMAIARFVNHLTQKEQTRAYARPIHAVAEELGLPDWVVEIRHNATHSVLPSLTMLRTAANTCLAWIKREYWDSMASDESSGDEAKTRAGPRPEQQLDDLLIRYMGEQFHEVSGGAPKDDTVMVEIIRLLAKCKDRASEVIVQEGYLIPTPEQLTAFNIQADDLIESEDLDLPPELVELWWPVLTNHRQALSSLLLALAREISGRGGLRDRLCAGWLAFLVTANRMAGKGSIFRQTTEVDAMRLLKTTLRNPNRYTAQVIKCYFGHLDLPLDQNQKDQLVELLDVYSGQQSSDDGDTAENHELYTLENVCNWGSDVQQSKQCDLWKRCQDLVDWRDFPLGSCPGVTLTFNDLELNPAVDKIQTLKSKVAKQDNSRVLNQETQPAYNKNLQSHPIEKSAVAGSIELL